MDKILTLFGAARKPADPLDCGAMKGTWNFETKKCTDYTIPDSIFGTNGIVTNIINWILYIVGIVSVVMIIVGGIRYATSAGNEKSVTAAKNTIIYALIGLAAALLAWVIVNFVIEIL